MRGDWQRVGEAVRTTRATRWRTRADFAWATGLSVRLIGDVENGRRTNYSPETISIIEAALRWEPGSIDEISKGGRPRPVSDPALHRLIAAWSDLPAAARLLLADLAERAARGEQLDR